MDPECCLWNVIFPYPQLMLAWSEVFLRETCGTLKLIEKIINSRKRILIILDGNLVQLAIIYTHSKGNHPSSSQIRSELPIVRHLVKWNIYLGDLSTVFFCSFNSTSVILYGGIDIGQVSGRISISKSISLSGGTLCR